MAARVIVVENDTLLLSAMASALTMHGLDVVGTSPSAAGVVALAQERRADVAMLDLDLGEGPTGLDIAVALRDRMPLIGLVLLTRFRDPRMMTDDLPEAPRGLIHLPKGDLADSSEVVRAVLAAARAPDAPRHRRGDSELSESQVAVMRLAAEGWSNAEIARRRQVSQKAVEKALGKLYERFGIAQDDAINPRAALVRTYLALVGDVDR